MLPAATADLYAAQRRRVAATLLLIEREWRGVGEDFDAGWSRVGLRITALLASAQVGAATDGAASVPVALEQSGFPLRQVARVDPRAVAGVASDGRRLDSLLYGAVVHAREVDAQDLAGRLRAGAGFLRVAAQVQVADAGRTGSTLAIAATPGAGYVRHVNPPCCQDCAVLAGRFFRYNAGFARHPGCDCVHRPVAEREPRNGYVQVVPAAQIKDLTAGQRAALDEGADLARVVNAYRGEVPGRRARMTTTTEAARRGAVRLTPDGILSQASSREESIALLREHGYLI